jgi:hydrophobe/amphiphile efflux-1 (HAE1) family protein
VQWLARVCVERPVFAWVLTLLVMVFGVAGYGRLGVDRFPDIDLPFVTVTTILPGASPEDVETDITDRIEAAVNTVGAIDELRSASAEGVSLVYIGFKLGKDPDVAAQEVRDKLDRIKADLPDGTEAPVVTKADPSAQPILYVALKAPGATIREVTTYADDVLKENLESVAGVGQVSVVGGRERQIRVLADPILLRQYGLPPGVVARALGSENLNVPGGRLDDGLSQLVVRVHGRVDDPKDFERIPLVTMGDRVVRVGDVATVEDGVALPDSAALVDGDPAVLLTIRKQSGANTVAVADLAKERLDELAPRLPKGWSLDVVRDDAASIRTSTDAVVEHLVVGAALAALVVLLFLGNVRSTLIAAIAIPTSVLGTFAVMALIGYTLNVITLLALALSVGIVIDDAIVVLENIWRKIEEEDCPPRQAAIEGTKEIGLAVLATTFSLVAVFLPVVFLAGIPGRFLRSFGVTMSVAIMVSLFVSFSLTPMLASQWLRRLDHGKPKSALERLVDAFYRPIEAGYLKLLGAALRRRWVVVLAMVGSLALIPVVGRHVPGGFLPISDDGQFEVQVRTPEGTALAETTLVVERVARQLRAWPEVTHTTVTVGEDEQRTSNLGAVLVTLKDPRNREASQEDLKERVRQELLPSLPKDLRVSLGDVAGISGGGRSTARIQFNLVGADLDELERQTGSILEKLRAVPGAVDVDSTLVVGKPELGVKLDRDRAADLGVSVSDVAGTLRLLVQGQTVGAYTEDGERYDVELQGPAHVREDGDLLGQVLVPTSTGPGVPLSQIATFERSTGPSVINRAGRQRAVTLLANAAPGHGDSEITTALQTIASEAHMPPGYGLEATGQSKLMKEVAISVLVGFGLAFVFMYLVLAAQFESWLHPVTILLSLPLTLPFALISLLVLGQGLNMFSALGIFVLFGIVKKNAILQIDHTNQLREHGLDRHAAVMRANKDRLRPILMTTFAFVAGMLPLVFSEGIGAGFNQATAGVVVGGQLLSLVLTLLAVPVAYTLFDDAAALVRRWFGRAKVRVVKRAQSGAA